MRLLPLKNVCQSGNVQHPHFPEPELLGRQGIARYRNQPISKRPEPAWSRGTPTRENAVKSVPSYSHCSQEVDGEVIAAVCVMVFQNSLN